MRYELAFVWAPQVSVTSGLPDTHCQEASAGAKAEAEFAENKKDKTTVKIAVGNKYLIALILIILNIFVFNPVFNYILLYTIRKNFSI